MMRFVLFLEFNVGCVFIVLTHDDVWPSITLCDKIESLYKCIEI